MPSAQLSRRR